MSDTDTDAPVIEWTLEAPPGCELVLQFGVIAIDGTGEPGIVVSAPPQMDPELLSTLLAWVALALVAGRDGIIERHAAYIGGEHG